MIKVVLRFDTNDYTRWLYAVRRVKRVAIQESENLPRKCAVEYYQRVLRNIMTQRITGYPPYTQRYQEWKQAMGLDKGFWRLHDNLIGALSAFKVEGEGGGTSWMGGVPNGIMVPRLSMFGGETVMKDIAMYGKAVEKKRPMFGPTAEEYINAGFWDSQVTKSKRQIMEAWS